MLDDASISVEKAQRANIGISCQRQTHFKRIDLKKNDFITYGGHHVYTA